MAEMILEFGMQDRGTQAALRDAAFLRALTACHRFILFLGYVIPLPRKFILSKELKLVFFFWLEEQALKAILKSLES